MVEAERTVYSFSPFGSPAITPIRLKRGDIVALKVCCASIGRSYCRHSFAGMFSKSYMVKRMVELPSSHPSTTIPENCLLSCCENVGAR